MPYAVDWISAADVEAACKRLQESGEWSPDEGVAVVAADCVAETRRVFPTKPLALHHARTVAPLALWGTATVCEVRKEYYEPGGDAWYWEEFGTACEVTA
jgi:hypothetical protein